jgi:hypothetical protein
MWLGRFIIRKKAAGIATSPLDAARVVVLDGVQFFNSTILRLLGLRMARGIYG